MTELRLEQTCSACPEQYDVYRGEEYVGYLRLRHGWFRAECPRGEIIFSTTDVQGDGSFKEHEREKFLNLALEAIRQELAKKENHANDE